jgi:hypothetical protein
MFGDTATDEITGDRVMSPLGRGRAATLAEALGWCFVA